jgi:hypothetical protein
MKIKVGFLLLIFLASGCTSNDYSIRSDYSNFFSNDSSEVSITSSEAGTCTTFTPFIVRFHPNGAEGEVYEQNIINCSTELSANQFTIPNGAFGGWNLEENGSGEYFENSKKIYSESSLIGKGNIDLYATWVVGSEGFKFKANETGYGVSNYSTTNKVRTIRVLETYCGKPVNIILDNALQGVDTVETIEIPASITKFGVSCFRGMPDLTKITYLDIIHSQLTRIDDWAFAGCGKLNNLTIPSSVETLGTEILYGTFWSLNHSGAIIIFENFVYKNYLTDLITYDVPDGIIGFADFAFTDSTHLTSITLPASLTTFGNGAFNNCSSLVSIAFRDDSDLYSINSSAVYNKDYSNLYLVLPGYAGEYIAPTSLKSVEKYALYSCTKITKVTLNSGLLSIGLNAFRKCNYIESINIPNTVTTIGNMAFAQDVNNNERSLKVVYIPLNVVNMGVSVFYGFLNTQVIEIEYASRPSGWNPSWSDNSSAIYRWNVHY